MVRHTLETVQYLLQDFRSVSDHFETLYIKGLMFVTIQIFGHWY